MRRLPQLFTLVALFSAIASNVCSNAKAAPALPADHLGSTFFSWVEIAGLGTPVTNWSTNDDEGHAAVEIPWAFPWFGNHYSTLYIDPNGNVGFEDWTVDTWMEDNRIPSAGQPNNRIAAFYEDMAGPSTGACGGEGGVYTYYDIANSRFIVQYDDWCSWNDYSLNTFEVILHPNGRVIIQYQNIPSAPANLTSGQTAGNSAVGVESPDGAAGRTWDFEIRNGTAWLYQPFEAAKITGIYLPLIYADK